MTKDAGGTLLSNGSNLSGEQAAYRSVRPASIGGTASEISDGKFSNGAKTTTFQYLFNEASATGGRISQFFEDIYNDFSRLSNAMTIDAGLGVGLKMETKYNSAGFMLGGELIYGSRMPQKPLEQGNFFTGSIGYKVSALGFESSINLMGDEMIYPQYGNKMTSVPLGIYRNHTLYNVNARDNTYEAGFTFIFFKLRLKLDGNKL